MSSSLRPVMSAVRQGLPAQQPLWEPGVYRRSLPPDGTAGASFSDAREALVVSITASDIAKGATLTSAEVDRVVLAAERINDAVCAAGCVP